MEENGKLTPPTTVSTGHGHRLPVSAPSQWPVLGSAIPQAHTITGLLLSWTR